ncbi:hypothetical protein MPLA_1350080 [Mesorhizobium sp. ORS 3359]|nr:hypothetical protein MPLA_1350080 [Mesorhizobium sp. ORS 3359]
MLRSCTTSSTGYGTRPIDLRLGDPNQTSTIAAAIPHAVDGYLYLLAGFRSYRHLNPFTPKRPDRFRPPSRLSFWVER